MSDVNRLRVAAEELASYAACSRDSNTPEFLEGLAERINTVAAALGDRDTFASDGRAITKQ